MDGARGETRTPDARFRKPTLYPLSYTSILTKSSYHRKCDISTVFGGVPRNCGGREFPSLSFGCFLCKDPVDVTGIRNHVKLINQSHDDGIVQLVQHERESGE